VIKTKASLRFTAHLGNFIYTRNGRGENGVSSTSFSTGFNSPDTQPANQPAFAYWIGLVQPV
jgi:hypothetical protein